MAQKAGTPPLSTLANDDGTPYSTANPLPVSSGTGASSNTMQGTAADGAAPVGNPVLVAGQDGTNVQSLKTDSTGALATTTAAAAAADVAVGYLRHTATTGAATLLTVPQGRTWVGDVSISVGGAKAAAATGNGEARGDIASAGAGVTPTAGTVASCSAHIGANAATGVTGTQGNNSVRVPLIVVAPAGNAVTLTLASTVTNLTAGSVEATASGRLV